MHKGQLSGRSILVVEDEFLQARETAEFLSRAGANVIGPTAQADTVPQLIAANLPDAAVLDINLGRGPDFCVANFLRAEGVPFLFLTGYERAPVPQGFADVPHAHKPADERQIVGMLEALCNE